MWAAAGLRRLPLPGGCVAVEASVTLPLGDAPVENVLNVLYDEIDGHCGQGRGAGHDQVVMHKDPPLKPTRLPAQVKEVQAENMH